MSQKLPIKRIHDIDMFLLVDKRIVMHAMTREYGLQ